MRLVDSHTHTWGPDTRDLPWHTPDLPPGWSGPYQHADLIADMNAADVDDALLVATSTYGRDERANEYTLRAIEAHPDRFWGVGVAEYDADEEEQRAAVRRVTAHDRMVGLRFWACFEYGSPPGDLDPTADWITSPELDPVFEGLAAQDAAAFVLPKPEQFEMLGSLVDRHPEVPFVVEHMGHTDANTSPSEPPWTDVETLAQRDNAYMKVSSIPRTAGEAWPYENVEPFLGRLLEWFGPERLMLGSDYPWLDEMATYRECLTWPEEAEYVSARDLSYLSYRTFDRLVG